MRVLSRVTEDDRDILKQSVKIRGDGASGRDAAGQTGAFNQALMELGATVCVPNGQARCESAAENLCRGHRDGIELEFPKKKAAKKPRRVEERPCWSF